MLKTEEVLGITYNTAHILMLDMNKKNSKIYASVTALYH
jgi:hypothetical protein